MPLVAILVGLIFIVISFRGTEHLFGAQVESDFGGGQFVSWAAATMILGSIGFYRPLRGLSNAAMGLVVVVLVLKNGGLFAQLASVIENPPAPAPGVPLSSFLPSTSSGTGGGGLLGSILDIPNMLTPSPNNEPTVPGLEFLDPESQTA